MTSPDSTQALRELVEMAINTCSDVTRFGRFSPAVDPVRWVEQLQRHLENGLREALASPALGETAGKELKAAYDEGYFAGVADAKYARRYGKVFNQTLGSSRDTEGR